MRTASLFEAQAAKSSGVSAAELAKSRAAAERSARLAQALDRLRAADADPSAPGIGAAAVGRAVLMLVVSDLRIDPRVEREARALAAAGYSVTVICPEDVNLVVEARMGAGQYRGMDAQADGPGSFRFDQRPDPDAPVLTLKVDMGLGDLEVIRP